MVERIVSQIMRSRNLNHAFFQIPHWCQIGGCAPATLPGAGGRPSGVRRAAAAAFATAAAAPALEVGQQEGQPTQEEEGADVLTGE